MGEELSLKVHLIVLGAPLEAINLTPSGNPMPEPNARTLREGTMLRWVTGWPNEDPNAERQSAIVMGVSGDLIQVDAAELRLREQAWQKWTSEQIDECQARALG